MMQIDTHRVNLIIEQVIEFLDNDNPQKDIREFLKDEFKAIQIIKWT